MRLIADSVLVVGLLYRARKRLSAPARTLPSLLAATFLCGLGLATASNDRVGSLAGEPVLAYHALWHLVGALGFMVLFPFNQVRFTGSGRPGTPLAALHL